MTRAKQKEVTMADVESSLWAAEAQVSAQRSRVESMMENGLNPDRAEAALRDVLGLLAKCQARRSEVIRNLRRQ